jgi:two-component system CheB/CheR fusion protein
VFTITADMTREAVAPAPMPPTPKDGDRPLGRILMVEDEPELCELLAAMLAAEGHEVLVAQTAEEAKRLAADEAAAPDLLLTDYDLRSTHDGLRVAADVVAARGVPLPTIVLTGDITTAALRAIAAAPVVRLSKPATAEALTASIATMLGAARAAAPAPQRPKPVPPAAAVARRTVHLIDDDPAVREACRALFEADGWDTRDHASAEAFLEHPRPASEACLIVDERLPGMSGVALLALLRAEGSRVPAIVLTGHGDAATAVAALRAGAADFIEKPAGGPALLASAARSTERARDAQARAAWRTEAAARFDSLTRREREVLAMVLDGAPNKNIAADLGISQRTVENHRAAVMHKTGATSLPDLVRLSLAAKAVD